MTDIKERTLSMTCTSQIDGVMAPDSHPHSVGNLTQSSERQNPWVTVTIPLTRSGHFSTLSPLFTLYFRPVGITLCPQRFQCPVGFPSSRFHRLHHLLRDQKTVIVEFCWFCSSFPIWVRPCDLEQSQQGDQAELPKC